MDAHRLKSEENVDLGAAAARLAMTTLSAHEQQLVMNKLSEGSIKPFGWIYVDDAELTEALRRIINEISDDEDIEPALEQAMRSFVVIKANVRKGRASAVFTECGVAVSATQAIAALHGQVAEGSQVTVVTRTGAQLSGTVGLMRYTPDVVDIAVIVLDEGLTFKIFTACATERVRIKQDLAVVGLEAGEHDDSERCADLCRVLNIPPGSSLLQCAYYQYNDASGAGVVTVRKGEELYVVGPHVAAKPATASADDQPPRKKAKTDSGVQVSSRGHCVVCEVNRVEGLIGYLRR